MAKILVVDDEYEMRLMLRLGLADHEVLLAENGLKALEVAGQEQPELIVLDVKMPGMDGFELCRHIRADPALAHIPVIFATTEDNMTAKHQGFDAGADDYITKPFELSELELRIKAILRRANFQVPETILQVGSITLDLVTRELVCPNGTFSLTPTEFSLLEHLMRNSETICPTVKLLEEIWNYKPGEGRSAVARMYIRHLREKLEETPSSPNYLLTVGRQGYMIKG